MNIISNWHKHLLVLTALAVFFRGGPIYVAVYVVLMLQIALGWSIKSTARTLKIHRNVSEYRLFPGERADVELTVVNERRIPLSWLHIIDDSHPSLKVTPRARFMTSLKARDKRNLNYTIEAKKRGVFSLSGATVETGDPFGLHQFMFPKRVIESPFNDIPGSDGNEKEIIVYPRVRPLSSLGLSTYFIMDGQGRSKQSLADPLKLIGTREYVVGESLRHVHWKASAHVGSLQMKMFEGTHHMDVSLLLDLRNEAYPSWNVEQISELAIETAASIVFETNKRRGSFDVTIIGKLSDGISATRSTANENRNGVVRLARGRGPEKVGSVLETLARIDLSYKDIQLESVIANNVRRLRPESTLVVISPRSDEVFSAIAKSVHTTYRSVVVIEMIGVTDRRNDSVAVVPPGVKHVYVSYAGDINELGRDTVG